MSSSSRDHPPSLKKKRRERGLAHNAWVRPLVLLTLALALSCAPTSGSTPAPAVPNTPEATATPTPTPIPTLVPTTGASLPTSAPEASATQETPVYGFRVVNEYPHDHLAFTQGLVYTDGILYEGTGLTLGRSGLRKVELETGEVLQIHNLGSEYFGEGISVVGDRIWQLTWKNQVAFLYDKETFEQLDTVQYSTEGWGLTYDGERLIMSDGTAALYFRDPHTFELLGQVAVYDEKGPVARLNELEYIDGQVFANVFTTDWIAIIDPATGRVDAWLDLTALVEQAELPPEVDVMNGIAYDIIGERLFVTGKWWPTLYEIELVQSTASFLPVVTRAYARDPARLRAAALQVPVK
ncbi:MAG: glutaminyl-peptide cyclotransferase [Anaerolineae bacterium]|nr:glutaminyl-peptide cyclotransferase [Anaerolineae bacterium]